MSDTLGPSGDATHRAFAFRFRLDGTLASRLSPMFDGMRDTASDAYFDAARCHVLSLNASGDGERFELRVDGAVSLEASDLGALLHHAVWEVTQRAVASRPHSVILHAGAVVLDDRLVLISGPSGAGKSTLVTALVADGAQYLTDEAVEVGASGVVLDALPRPIHLSRDSIDLLGTPLNDSDVPMPGGGGYRMPPVSARQNWPTATLIVHLDRHRDQSSPPDTRRCDVVARLVSDSFGAMASSQAGLEIVKKSVSQARLATVSGGSVAACATLVKDAAGHT